MSYPVKLFDRIRATSTEYAHINVLSGYVIKDRITVEYNTPHISSRLVLSRADAQALYAALGKHIENIALEAPADAT